MNFTNRILSLFLFVFFGILTQAQTDTLTVRLSRDWGYGGGRQIQGRFSLHAEGSETLVRVDFLLDNEIIATDTEPPFKFQFSTDDFPPGLHALTATGMLADGTVLTGRVFTHEFISKEEASSKTTAIIVPILVVLGIVILVSALAPVLFKKNKSFTPGVYGIAGGAVCPRCGLPFARSFLALNMVFGKLERCPHCGKWAIVPAASPTDLSAAEKRWKQAENIPVNIQGDSNDRYRQLVDESKFEE